MSKYSIFFSMIFLVIISIISFWLNNEVKKELNIEEKKLTNNPDYFLKNFISKQTDDLGNLNFSLEAKQMNYFSYSDESILKKPVFIVIKMKFLSGIKRTWMGHPISLLQGRVLPMMVTNFSLV